MTVGIWFILRRFAILHFITLPGQINYEYLYARDIRDRIAGR